MTWPVDPKSPPFVFPMLGSRPLDHPVVKTEQPCAVCGKQIVGGTIYKPGKRPTHFGCRA